MNKIIDLDLTMRRQALDSWLTDCKRRIGIRFPKIDFNTDHWPVRTFYQTPQMDWSFTKLVTDLATKDICYTEVLRCLVSEMLLAGKPKDIRIAIASFRLLATSSAKYVFEITLQDLREIQSSLLIRARDKPISASKLATALTTLTQLVSQLATKGVLPRLGFHQSAEVKAELRMICKAHQAQKRAGIGDTLNLKMEAFNEALNALADKDKRLSPADLVAIAAATRALCAPSRINEVLCSSIDDHVTVEDYAQKEMGKTDASHRSHQMLLMTMKGSKGSQWNAKPVLNFMIDVFHHMTGVIQDHGKRSRMLVEWYQQHPKTLYLPPELQYLRGLDLNRSMLAKIVNLTENPPEDAHKSAARLYFIELKNQVFKALNPDTHRKNGSINSRSMIEYLHWEDVEKLLLKKIYRAMDDCRKVTSGNHYEGNLAKMLFLFDRDETPYLPYALNYEIIGRRFKQTDAARNHQTLPPTLFEKLNITMPVNCKIQIAEMETHDPRRWLTTMAQQHGEMLSDVLINKWANRSSLSQLKTYDFRTAEDLAEFSRMPDSPKLNELTDLSNGLATVQDIKYEFGLKTALVTAHNVGISMTSIDMIVQATENRPVARTSRGIVILYPQRFGICLHQHHEKPCRNYSNSVAASCVTCNEGAYIKGHFSTNDETRKLANQLFKSILSQLEKLAHAHNRGIADNQDALDEHILMLVKKAATLEEVAIQLIEEFHQLKHLFKDKLLSRRLEVAFVTREVVKRLDSPLVTSGALIRYNNPIQHADPLLEVALNSHGGREQVARDEQKLVEEFPEFVSKPLGLKDGRHLVEPDEGNEDN